MKNLCILLTLLLWTSVSYAQNNATPLAKENIQDNQSAEPKIPDSIFTSPTITQKLPLDIQAKGMDACGTLLSYKIKEELMDSKLFALSISPKKKFILHLQSLAEFPDRPTIASQYSIALVYQEDAGILSYYLDQIQGQVHQEDVALELQKILEWAYATVKRYTYLLE